MPTVPYQPIPAPRASLLRERVSTTPALSANTVAEQRAANHPNQPAKPGLPTSEEKFSTLTADPFNMPALDFSHEMSKSTSHIPDKTNNNVPAEQTRNVSVSRQNAFYNTDRPASVKRRSLQPGLIGALSQQAMKEARTEFFQTEAIKPDLSSGSLVDIFDPLAMGSDSSLSSIGSGNVAGGLRSGAHVDNGDSQDDLLKEWNLDTHFNKMKIDNTKGGALTAQHPPVPPQAPMSTMRPSIPGGAGFRGPFSTAGQPTGFGMNTAVQSHQPFPGVPRPYQSTSVTSLIGNGSLNRNSMPPLSSTSPLHAQLASLQQRSQSPSQQQLGGSLQQIAPPMLRPLSSRGGSPEKQGAPPPPPPNRESRGTSPAIAQTIASLNAASEYHGGGKPNSRLAAGSVRKTITNIEQTQKPLDILGDLSFLQTSPAPQGTSSERNTPSPAPRNQWETFD